MAFFFFENVIKDYLEALREKHAEVEFDYLIALETRNGEQSVYTVSHSNKTQAMKTVWRYKVFENRSIGLFCAIPGVFTTSWFHPEADQKMLRDALDEIYGSKLLKGMRGVND